LKDAMADTRSAVAHRLELALSERERFAPETFHDHIAGHPLVRRLAARVVFGAFDAEGALLGAFRPERAGGATRTLDAGGSAVSLGGAASFGVLHPLEIDALGSGLREAFQEALSGAKLDQPIDQLGRAIFPAAAAWPELRGTVIPYRKLERL